MGIEPTQNGTSALLTVLKTAEPTRTLPPPKLRIISDSFSIILHICPVLATALFTQTQDASCIHETITKSLLRECTGFNCQCRFMI